MQTKKRTFLNQIFLLQRQEKEDYRMNISLLLKMQAFIHFYFKCISSLQSRVLFLQLSGTTWLPQDLLWNVVVFCQKPSRKYLYIYCSSTAQWQHLIHRKNSWNASRRRIIKGILMQTSFALLMSKICVPGLHKAVFHTTTAE